MTSRELLLAKLKETARQIEPWNTNGEYVLPFADLRELLEAVVKELEGA